MNYAIFEPAAFFFIFVVIAVLFVIFYRLERLDGKNSQIYKAIKNAFAFIEVLLSIAATVYNFGVIPVQNESISLSRCDFVESSNEPGSNSDVAVGDWIDVFGDHHPNSIKFWVMDKPGWSSVEHTTYYVGGKYKTLAGNFVAEQSSEDGSNFVFEIFLDGVRKYTTKSIDNSSQAVNFSYNIRGANEICIVCYTSSSSSGYCIFDAVVY